MSAGTIECKPSRTPVQPRLGGEAAARLEVFDFSALALDDERRHRSNDSVRVSDGDVAVKSLKSNVVQCGNRAVGIVCERPCDAHRFAEMNLRVIRLHGQLEIFSRKVMPV